MQPCQVILTPYTHHQFSTWLLTLATASRPPLVESSTDQYSLEPDPPSSPPTSLMYRQEDSDQEFRLHLSIPPSAIGQEIMLTMSPKKTRRPNHLDGETGSRPSSVVPQTPKAHSVSGPETPKAHSVSGTPTGSGVQSQLRSPPPSLRLPIDTVSITSTESSLSLGDPFVDDPVRDEPVLEGNYIPIHCRPLRLPRSQLPLNERYAVPADILAMYRPDPEKGYGFRERRWYVVWRGLELGIFYDFWLGFCVP